MSRGACQQESAVSTGVPLGGRVGGWTIEAVIGSGATSTVYLARDEAGEHVALKVLGDAAAADPAMRERFLREAKIARAIDHRGVIPIEAVTATDAGAPALVMELVEGESLERVWRRLARRLPPIGALRIAGHVLDALAAAHARGIVHRDVKPGNVLIASSGAIKLVDFGIAHAPGLGGDDDDAADGDTTLGTPSFMAPEQALLDAADLDGRADVFSVGAMLYTLISGQLLHRGATHDESLLSAATRAAPSLRQADVEVEASVIAIVDRALAFRRDDRFEGASAMRAAIDEVLAREALRLSIEPHRHGDLTDGVEPGGPLDASSCPSERPSRPARARGTLRAAALPQLFKSVFQRRLTGRLALVDGPRRHQVHFARGVPCAVLGDESPILTALERLGALPEDTRYEFVVDDEPHGAPACDPLAAILAVSRRWRAPALDSSLSKLGRRALRLDARAAVDRFALHDDERAVVRAVRDRALTYPQLVAEAPAPHQVIDALLYALGITHHLDVGAASRSPLI